MPPRAAFRREGSPPSACSAKSHAVQLRRRVHLIAAFSALVAACAMLTGCYDSQWGQQKVAQQHNAAAAAPAELRLAARGSAAEPAAPAARDASVRVQKLRVRALVTRSFTAQVVDAPRHLRDLFDDVNRITEPELGLHLELVDTRPWPIVDEDDIVKTFDALRTADAGGDVDWVVGFAGSLPRATRSFHDVGRGALVGKHLLVRAPSSAERHDSIEKAFDQLPEEQRRDLEKRLRRHRATVVFLHELGHTLGAEHDTSPQSIMFPEYNAKVTAFGAGSVDVMREGMAKRNAKSAAPAAAATAAVAVAVSDAPPPEPAAIIPDTPELEGAARERFAAAYQASLAGDVVAAWSALKPLFERYLTSMAVQDLRCQLASRSMRFELARRECAPLMKLSTGR
jgi:hypothetical protein